MSSILALSFRSAEPVAQGAWPLTAVADPSCTTYDRGTDFLLDGFGPASRDGWRPRPGEVIRIDADDVAAAMGEFAVDLWIDSVAVLEAIALVGGAGSPVEIGLLAGANPGTFQVVASVRTTGVPVVLLSGDLSVGAGSGPARIGVWVSGSDAVLTFQGVTQRRLRFTAAIPDARGEIVIGGPAAGSSSTLDLVAVWVRDELDGAADAELARAAAEGIGEIDSLIASGTANRLGVAEGPEQILGRVRWRPFQHGTVFWSATTGAHAVYSRLLAPYTQAGGATGRLGLPTSPEMGLDDLLTWLKVPGGFDGGRLRGGDVFERIRDLGVDDLVIEHAVPKKPDPRPRERGDWRDLVTTDPRLGPVVVAPERALDADWIATALGHVGDEVGPVRRREGRPGRRGASQEGGGVAFPWLRAGRARRRGAGFGVEGLEEQSGTFLTAMIAAGAVTGVREAVTRFDETPAGRLEAGAALWGVAESLREAEVFSIDDTARLRVIQLPEVAADLTITAAPPAALDAVVAAALREQLVTVPDEVVTIAAGSLPGFAAAVGTALESGEVSAVQASALLPNLALRNSVVSDFVGSDGAVDVELAERAASGPLADLIAQGMRSGIDVHVEVSGVIWNIVGPRAQLFQHGALISTARGVFEIGEHILSHWVLLGGSRGLLGAPRDSEKPVTGGTAAWADAARWVPFAGGHIYWSAASGAHEVHGAILARCLEKSATGMLLFIPTIGELLGPPITDEQPVEEIAGARTSAFLRGRVYWSDRTGAWEVYPEILAQLNASGGLRAWGLPTGPQSVRLNGGQRLLTQPFQRGTIAILVRDGVTTVLDSLEVGITKITAGEIDDDTWIFTNRDAELIVRARVWADDRIVLDQTTPRGGRIQSPGWKSAAIDPRRLSTLRILLEAWDWDETNDPDILAVVDVTHRYDDDFFGFAAGGAWGMRTASDQRGDARAPVVFEYTIGREVAVSLDRLRQDLFWYPRNAGRAELPWRMYRDSFDDIDADSRGDADPFERGVYDARYRVIGAGGNCAGFSVTTVDAFLGRDLVQPLSDANLQIEDGNRFWQKINEGQGRQLASTILSWRADGTDDDDFCDPRRVFRRVDSALTGTRTPVILFFWFEKDKDTKGGHAVLVWRCEQQGSKRIMYLADSNWPYPVLNDFTGSRIEIESDGSYQVFPTSQYADWGAGAWKSGSLGDEYMIEVPYGLYSRPLRSPAFDLGSGFLGQLGGVFSATGASVEQVSSGSRRLYGDQRGVLLDRVRDRSDILDAMTQVGMLTPTGPVVEDHPVDTAVEGFRLSAALDAQRLVAVADAVAPGLRGAELRARLGEVVQLLPGAATAGSVWQAAARAGIDIHLENAGIGSWLSPGAWPGVADVTPADDRTDGSALIAFRGTVPDDVVTQLRGRGEGYRLTMMGRNGVVTVGAPLARGSVDTVQAVALSGVRTGVVVTGAAGERVASLTLEAAVRGGTPVGWSLPLGIGGEPASVRWLPGRPGIEIRHASAVPDTPIEWGGVDRARTYATPSAAPGERIRVMPDDPASPFGAIRLQRRSDLGDVIQTEVIEPAG